MADPNANILSLSIPTDLLTGAGGGNGLNLSYNFGPNVDTIANSAYSFLGQQFSGAQTFEAHSIMGTQDFLSASVNPIVDAVANESDSYYSQLLGAFGQTIAAQQQIGNAAVNAQESVSQASISASRKSQGSGSIFSSIFGGCFITTAVCKYSGLPDDCETLQTMRAWRDGWMQETAQRRALVDAYYVIAPRYVEKISALPESMQKTVWTMLRDMIANCADMIHCGCNELALAHYLAAVTFARECTRIEK